MRALQFQWNHSFFIKIDHTTISLVFNQFFEQYPVILPSADMMNQYAQIAFVIPENLVAVKPVSYLFFACLLKLLLSSEFIKGNTPDDVLLFGIVLNYLIEFGV